MLLRNLDQAYGLCNGTRLIASQLAEHVIEATVISGNNFGNRIFLPRTNMSPLDTNLPFRLQRPRLQRPQYPIVFCITIETTLIKHKNRCKLLLFWIC